MTFQIEKDDIILPTFHSAGVDESYEPESYAINSDQAAVTLVRRKAGAEALDRTQSGAATSVRRSEPELITEQ